MIAQNLNYLRQKANISQQELAEKLSMPRSSISDYERGKTQISIEMTLKIAEIFKVNIEALVREDLSLQDLEVAKSEDLRVLAITIDSNNRNNIELVERKAEAGYLESFGDPQFIKNLPKISFPNIPLGTYRAFEIQGDSMLPMESGTIVIAAYVEHLTEIKKDKTYIIISKSGGLVYKRVWPDAKNKKLTLISDNDSYLPYELHFKDIAEIWQYYAHLSFNDSKHTFQSMVEEKISNMQGKINEMYKVVVNQP
jgi:transcriptional regulator with XRE-family HTH domain